MKRFFIAMIVCMLLLICGLCATAESSNAAGIRFSGSDRYVSWTLDMDGTLVITPKSGVASSRIEREAGYEMYCSYIKKVVIEDGISFIGSFVFQDFISLTSVTIPESVTSIGSYAFYDCGGLTSITIGNDKLSIGDCAFYKCSRLASVEFSAESNSNTGVSMLSNVGGESSIGAYAFAFCKSLTSIKIPEGFTSIGACAFLSSNLKYIKLPASLTNIAAYAFGNMYDMNAEAPVGSYAWEWLKKWKEGHLPTSNCGIFTITDGENMGLVIRGDEGSVSTGFVLSDSTMPEKDCRIGIHNYDSDWPNGEADRVFINGRYLGMLTGQNETWNTTYFNVPLSYLVVGTNEIVIHIGDQDGTIDSSKWVLEVDSITVQLDYGAKVNFSSAVTSANLSSTNGVEIVVQSSAELEKSMSCEIEYSLVDKRDMRLSSYDQIVASVTTSHTGASFGDDAVTLKWSGGTQGNYLVQCTLRGDGEVLAYDEHEVEVVKENEIVVKLTTANNKSISKLYQVNGSLFPSSNEIDTGSPMYKLAFGDLEEPDLITKVTIDLPNPFSFEFDSMVTSRDFTGDELRNKSVNVYAHSLDSKTVSELVFKVAVSGTEEYKMKIPVSYDNHSNTVYCRASNVNQTVDLSPNTIRNASVSTYNQNLAWMGNTLSQAAYDESYVKKSLRNLGYSYVKTYGYGNSNEGTGIACAIGLRSIQSDSGAVRHCLAMVIRGTFAIEETNENECYWIEWAGDFSIFSAGCNEKLHRNFLQCADSIDTYMTNYLADCSNAGFPVRQSDARLYVTGHSRGAAVADLYAHFANSRWGGLTCYTFATPNSTKTPEEDSYIFNFVNLGDMVGYVPAGSTWGKYGQTIVVGEMDPVTRALIDSAYYFGDDGNELLSRKDVRTAFGKLLSNSSYESASSNPVGVNHGADMYLSLMPNGVLPAKKMLFSAAENQYKGHANAISTALKGLKYATSLNMGIASICSLAGMTANALKAFAVYCPVDVTVNTTDGKTIATFVDHELVYMDYAYGIGLPDGDGYCLVLNADMADYVLEISANDDGTMDVYTADIDLLSETAVEKRYEDVPITEGSVYQLSDGVELEERNESGTCGIGLTWTLSRSGWLVIRGVGAMDDFAQGQAPWDGMGDITSVVIKDGVTGIGANAFYGCDKMTNVTIAATIKNVGTSAFAECTYLATVHYDGALEEWNNITIEEHNECLLNAKLETSASWNTYKNIRWKIDENGKLTIAGKGRIPDFSFFTSAPWVTEGGFTSAVIQPGITGIGKYAFAEAAVMTSVTIPSTVADIAESAFQWCINLTDVEMADGVTAIGKSAFDTCVALKQISIPDSVTQMSGYVFNDCESLEKVVMGSSVREIGSCAFSGCVNLTDIELPAGLTVISSCLFSRCESIKSVKIPSTVTVIDNDAFNNCRALEKVTIPDCVTTIGRQAFGDCENLRNIDLPLRLNSLGENAFSGSGIESIVIPNGVTQIGSYTFQACTDLESIEIPLSVKVIEDDAFRLCDENTLEVYYRGSLADWNQISIGTTGNAALQNAVMHFNEALQIGTELILPKAVTAIDAQAFTGAAMKSVRLSENCISIGSEAFAQCQSLAMVYIPNGNCAIADDAFSGVLNLTIVTLQGSRVEAWAKNKGFIVDYI